MRVLSRAFCAVLTITSVLLPLACGAQEAVKNPAFSELNADGALAAWSLPEDGQWRHVPEGGPDGKACIAWHGPASVGLPARQRCDFATPNAKYQVQALVRGDGVLRPTVRVSDAPTREALVTVSGAPEGGWQRISAAFTTKSADLVVELFADAPHATGEPGVEGLAWIAEVSVAAQKAAEPMPLPDGVENVALGKPYTMTAPNYSYSTDPDDKTQLTDGVYTEGHFWTRKTTVGWSGMSGAHVSIDLGQPYAIKGVCFSTAAGVADVRWPARVLLFVSDDGQQWFGAGDLVALSASREPLPAYGEYHTARLWTDRLREHGRYVRLYIEPGGGYSFTDEIEVWRGDDAWLADARPAGGITDLEQHMRDRTTNSLIQQQLVRDLTAVRIDLATVPEPARGELSARADTLTDAVASMPIVSMDGFKAIVPMTDLERDILRLQAAVWRAQGKAELRLWDRHRWDPLEAFDEPDGEEVAAVEVHMMNNEHRADVFNITNAADADARLTLRLTGLPGGDNPPYVTVHEVLTVGTRRFIAVSAALPEATKAADGYGITVPSGMTRQVWLSFNPRDLPTGLHEGQIELRRHGAAVETVPLRVHIYPLRFPDETTLLVGGWDYTNAQSMYGITPKNRQAVIGHLQDHYVNAPWATSAAMTDGTYDDAGVMITEPDTGNFDAWVAAWPEAKMYLVYKAVGDSFDGAKMGTRAFDAKVGSWAAFWAEHMERLGLRANQLGVLILDEPHSKPQYDIITAWARAMEAAAPGIVTWEDPQPAEDKECLEMFSSVDVLCPYRHPFLAQPDWYRELFLNQQKQGRELWFYNADGPARCFDPYSFYLAQEWHAFKIGAKGSCFWAFGDNSRVSCWNEYPAGGPGPYCPTYIDEDSITAAKYMEAIREGTEDYEYLTMLKSRVDELAAEGVDEAKLAAARELLTTGPDRVMAQERGANYRWDESKDRTVQDQVRIELLQTLTELQKL